MIKTLLIINHYQEYFILSSLSPSHTDGRVLNLSTFEQVVPQPAETNQNCKTHCDHQARKPLTEAESWVQWASDKRVARAFAEFARPIVFEN